MSKGWVALDLAGAYVGGSAHAYGQGAAGGLRVQRVSEHTCCWRLR